MALPLAERVALAQELWASLETGDTVPAEAAVVREALRRDGELSAGIVAGRTHEEVMQAARRAIGCG